MRIAQKALRADETRRTRFHTSNGRLCLQPVDMLFALGTTILRRASGRLVDLPWIALPAYRFLREKARDAIVFEYSVGTSTLWYARRCRRLYAVEDDPVWFDRVRKRTRGFTNVTLELARGKEEYVHGIDRVPEIAFDIVSVDGSHRRECLERAAARVKPGGILVVDNTDTGPGEELAAWLVSRFPDGAIRREAGYAPGILHPVETTVCVTSGSAA